MTLAEIRERYQSKWVLIAYHQLGANLEVVEGDVIAESGPSLAPPTIFNYNAPEPATRQSWC